MSAQPTTYRVVQAGSGQMAGDVVTWTPEDGYVLHRPENPTLISVGLRMGFIVEANPAPAKPHLTLIR